jgi:mRNA interferase MazF
MKRGEVVWVDLGNPPGGSGREQAGDRPGVVISAGDSEPGNPMVTFVPLTCVRNANRFPHTVDNIVPSNANGLRCISVALIFQIRSLDKNRVRRIAGNLEEHYLSQIEEKIKNMLSI